MADKIAVRALVILLGFVTLSGCTSSPATTATSDVKAAPVFETVSRENITSVVTVPAVVAAGSTANVTAPVAGSVKSFGSSVIAFTGPRGTTEILLPAGVAIHRQLVKVGQSVPANYPIAVADITAFAVVADLDQSALYRLYSPPISARAQITNGPGPFDCALINRVPTFRGITEGTTGLTVTCVLPPDTPVFAGMPAVMALITKQVRNALALPVEAVAGSAERGMVRLVRPDGTVEDRQVTLGVTDGVQIQILSGLSVGDKVQVPGPDLAGGGN